MEPIATVLRLTRRRLIHRSWQSSPGFSGLTFGELCRRRRIRQPLPARPIVLTFDDGYATSMEGFR